MSVLKIMPKFKSDEERYTVAAAIGLTLICGGYLSFIPPLVVYFGLSNKLTDTSKLIVRQFINFMINIALAMVILTVTVIGSPLAAILVIVGLVFVIIDLLAVLNGTELQIPVFIEFLKEPVNTTYEEQPGNEQNKDELKP